MKSLLLSVVMLSTTSLFAQKIVFGVNGGVGFNTNPSVISESDYYLAGKPNTQLSTLGSVTALVDNAKWQYGVEIGYRSLSYKTPFRGFGIPEHHYNDETTFISKTAVPVKAVLNRKLVTGRFENYAGISAGYLRAMKCEDMNALDQVYYDHVNGNGLVAGVQAGSIYYITRHIGINAAINCDFMWLTIGAATYKMFDIPATVGVRYRL